MEAIEDIQDDDVDLEDIVALVCSRLEQRGQQGGRLVTLLDECIAEILAENVAWSQLTLDHPGFMHWDDLKLSFRILHGLVQSGRFTTLTFHEHNEGFHSFIPVWLDHTLPFMDNVEEVAFSFSTIMSTEDAEAIFARVRASTCRISLLTMYCYDRHGIGVTNALVDCLQAPSTIKELQLACIDDDDSTLSEETFQAICNALPNCSSLETLAFTSLVVRGANAEHMLSTLTDAIVGSSVTEIDILDEGSTFTAEQLFRAFAQADSIHNHESLMVRRPFNNRIYFDRTCTVVNLSDVVRLVRERIQGGGNVEGEEECVASILARKTTWNNLDVDASNQNELQDWSKILHALAAGHRFEVLTFGSMRVAIPGNLVLALLDDILPVMIILLEVKIWNISMSDTEADAIFRQIKNSHISKLSVTWNQSNNNLMSALIDCLQGPFPISELSLTSHDDDQSVPEEMFQLFCDALPDCPSLEALWLYGLLIRTTNVDHVANVFSAAVVDSSLANLIIMDEQGTLSADNIFQSLLRRDAVRNLDLVLLRQDVDDDDDDDDDDGNITIFEFDRSCWWKRVLTIDMPLNVWSIILKQADKYDTPDILHYLYRENNAMLIPR